MRRFLNMRNALIASTLVTVVLFTALVFTLIPYIQLPSPTPSIKVIERYGDIKVPTVITAGVPFEYQLDGNKLVSTGADVRLQINCEILGSESINTIATFYSNVDKGIFHIQRILVIPVNSKVNSSEDCYLQSISTYTFYQVDSGGSERTISVLSVGRSNHFKLVVPPTSSLDGTNDVSVLPVNDRPLPSPHARKSPSGTGDSGKEDLATAIPPTDTASEPSGLQQSAGIVRSAIQRITGPISQTVNNLIGGE